MDMTGPEGRVALRRETHDLNDALEDLLRRLTDSGEEAAGCVKRARASLFEAWTLLCTPPEEEEDH